MINISEGLAIALVTASATLIAQLIVTKREKSVRDAKLDEKLDQIQKRLDTHNHYAEKMGVIEDSLLLIQQDVKYIKEGRFNK